MEHSLASRSVRHVWHPCTQMKRHEAAPPIAIDHATGPWLVDTEGRRYLDGISSCGSICSVTRIRISGRR